MWFGVLRANKLWGIKKEDKSKRLIPWNTAGHVRAC
jgi:hypothetical protein